MKYMLDTNICIYIINNRPKKVLQRFVKHPVSEFGISSITQSELMYGIMKSRDRDVNFRALESFFLPLTVLPYEGTDIAACYAEIRCQLESQGKIIGPLDMLIAAHALSLDLILVSNNLREFKRVKGLKCENWVRR